MYSLKKEESGCFSFVPDFLEAETAYTMKVRAELQYSESKWSDEIEFTSPKFSECCIWKECPDSVKKKMKYSVDEMNSRIATKINNSDCCCCCTIIGNTFISHNKVISWSIKILNSNNDGGDIYIGVAPSDIDQNKEDNYNKCGWYFCCYISTLWSGPPHNYNGWKEYGPRKEKGQYIHTGDSVGVVMDTAKGELSFVVDGVNFGVAFDGIPLDKPLVPCVILYYEYDSVELDTSEVKETKVSGFIPFPSNITTKSNTWDSITLSWDVVEGASFYQIEVDGSKFWDASTTSTFTKRGLLAETEHSFRVRTVFGNEVSEWSDAVKRKTQKESFETSWWKECPDDAKENKKYSVNEMNPRVATKIKGNEYSLVIGNTPLPHNKVTSWSIRILKTKNNDGSGIFIGVAPFDINQNENDAYYKCGWYYDCCTSTLCSGPPHRRKAKKYGPRKGNGQYVHTEDSVGVVMDTAKGDLSFIVSGVNLGVAFEGIPLDKPLVPCVLLYYEYDSVEFIT